MTFDETLETTKHVCDCCGAEVECEDDLIPVYLPRSRWMPRVISDYVCEKCANDPDQYGYDDVDGRLYAMADLVWIEDAEEYVNITRAEDDYYQCDECGKWFTRDSVQVDDDGNVVCNHCFSAYDYSICEDCGRLIRGGEAYFTNDGEYAYCEYCWENNGHNGEDLIHEYGYKPNPYFHRHDSSDEERINKLFMGVELEIDKGDYKVSCAEELTDLGDSETLFYLKSDCSLDDGIEIVTHPCTLQYHLNDFPWNDIHKIARRNGFTSHDANTCGLHVHVSKAALGDTDMEKDLTTAKIIMLVDRFWDEMVSFSRRDYQRLARWACKPNAEMEDTDSEEDIIRKSKELSYNRYYAVNLCNWNTIEFRLFRGTLNVNTILATLQFVDNLVRFAKEIRVADIQNAKFINICNYHMYPELKMYLEQRGLIEGTVAVEENEVA